MPPGSPTPAPADLDYLEWIATATWRDRAWLMLGASSDVFATGKHRHLRAGRACAFRSATRARLEVAGGYYWLDHAYGRSYAARHRSRSRGRCIPRSNCA